MALLDIDLNTFTLNLIHVCCNYTDENYLQNAKDKEDFSTTRTAVQLFESTLKTLLNAVQKKTNLKQSFETLKHCNSVKELNNDMTSILFLETDRKEAKHLCVKKADVVYFRAFFELYFYEKCVTERYLRYTKQTTRDEPVFHHFAWSEWQSFSTSFSALIELVCNIKKISSSAP